MIVSSKLVIERELFGFLKKMIKGWFSGNPEVAAPPLETDAAIRFDHKMSEFLGAASCLMQVDRRIHLKKSDQK